MIDRDTAGIACFLSGAAICVLAYFGDALSYWYREIRDTGIFNFKDL